MLMNREDALCPPRSAPRRQPSRPSSTRSSSGCGAAAASSTRARARPAGSRRSTPRSARRRSASTATRSSPLVAGADAPVARASARRPRTTQTAGRRALEALGVGATDAVVAISASGRTPFTLGALGRPRAAGAFTACVVCVPALRSSAALVEHEIMVARRPGVPRGLDTAQGRDGAEARPQHDLDDRDDPPRQDLRRT